MPTVYYLAYGSNLHPQRLTERVCSAHVVGVIDMPGYLLAFHKRSRDDSGKCLLYPDQGQQHKAYGVLYEFDASEKLALDGFEGLNKGYVEQLIEVHLNGKMYTASVYVAQPGHIDSSLVPYDWYKDLVLAGAKYHGFPAEYIGSIEATPSKPDLDDTRREAPDALLRKMGCR
jgi:hypothetical protein